VKAAAFDIRLASLTNTWKATRNDRTGLDVAGIITTPAFRSAEILREQGFKLVD
jgi:hypothetical protein